ncbi:MAG: Zn-ribbon domain-containing OB-fold protein [Armatimonadetes bacterium]|nr:Zn-ribbon domain-containing OB-fold protein [Armatimonadota bacterium]
MKMEFKGVSLKESDFKEKKILSLENKPNLKYAWDTGVAIGRFLAELKQGRLIGRKCCKCRRIMIPPRMFCEVCFKPNDEWIYLKDKGTVNTFSICYVSWDMQKLKEPQIPAVIEIEGASKMMGILHLLGEVEPKEVKIGMKVKAVWKEIDKREGAITDIKYFKPI